MHSCVLNEIFSGPSARNVDLTPSSPNGWFQLSQLCLYLSGSGCMDIVHEEEHDWKNYRKIEKPGPQPLPCGLEASGVYMADCTLFVKDCGAITEWRYHDHSFIMFSIAQTEGTFFTDEVRRPNGPRLTGRRAQAPSSCRFQPRVHQQQHTRHACLLGLHSLQLPLTRMCTCVFAQATHNVVVMNHPSDPSADLTNRVSTNAHARQHKQHHTPYDPTANHRKASLRAIVLMLPNHRIVCCRQMVEAITSRKAVRLLQPRVETSVKPGKKKRPTVVQTLIPSPKHTDDSAAINSTGVWSAKFKCKELPGSKHHPTSFITDTEDQHTAVQSKGVSGTESKVEPGGDGEQKTEHGEGLLELREKVAADHRLLSAKLKEVEAVLGQTRQPSDQSGVMGDEDGWCLIRVQAEGVCV